MRQALTRDAVDYQVLRTNEKWSDHMMRTFVTAGVVTWLYPQRVIDPACGDGSILLYAHAQRPIPYALLGDISVPNMEYLNNRLPTGWNSTVGDALDILRSQDDKSFDVVVLTEILEHLDDPNQILREARRVGTLLVASSPQMRHGQIDKNPEHLWMFDHVGYQELLIESGWVPGPKTFLDIWEAEYDFQIWSAK